MSRITLFANWVLRLPLLWGGLATLAFYAAVQSGYRTDFIEQYFASHFVEVVATLMFAVGVSAVVVRLVGLLPQLASGSQDPLGAAPPGGQPVDEAGRLVARLDALPAPMQRSHLVNRLRAALGHVQDTGSADTLEETLARLEEVDRDRVAGAYALPRLIRAVLPIVGMLGTVIGITLAIGQLSPTELENSLPLVMDALSVAFDTTAQAMSLMLVLWFVMFAVERVEDRVLVEVDRAVSRSLLGRFQVYGSATDPNVATVRRMGEQVVSAVERLAVQQSDTWQSAIDATNTRWAEATASSSELLTTTLRDGLSDGLAQHAASLGAGVSEQLDRLADRVGDRLDQLREAEQQHARRLSESGDRHVRLLSESGAEHVASLATGADGLLRGLRDGLERMAELLVEALQRHGEALTAAEQNLAAENRRHLSEVEAALGESMVVAADRQEKLIRQSESVLREMQQALVSAATATLDQQSQLVKQGETLLKVVDTTAGVQELEETLNRNLATLGRAHNFEETLMSLSAAIQLLSARVGHIEAPAKKASPKVASKTQPPKAA